MRCHATRYNQDSSFCRVACVPEREFSLQQEGKCKWTCKWLQDEQAVGTTARVLYQDYAPVSYQTGLKGKLSHSMGRVSGPAWG